MCRRLLCYGDSNTYGYDPRSYLGGRYPRSVRWTALLDAEGWEVINAGENGRSIPRLEQEIKMAVQMICHAEADALVVMLGSNDLLQCPGLAAEVCEERMERFLSALLAEIQPDLKVLLTAPPPMAPGAWVDDPRIVEGSHRLAGCYEGVVRRLGIAFADAGAWEIGLTFDGVHFSEAGHLAFAKGIRAALDELFKQSNSQ